MKKIVKGILGAAGLEVSKRQKSTSQAEQTTVDPLKKYYIKTEGILDFYSTPIGDYYVPNDAPEDVVINHMRTGEYFEQEVIELAKTMIRPNTIVLDVGSNFGQMAVVFSKLVGENGLVYAFEADDFVFEVLKKNLAANNCSNVIPVFGAVYNKSGAELIFPKQDMKRFVAYGSYGIDPTATNGRVVKSLMIDDIDFDREISFMKVDVQGSDLFALQGAKNTLRKWKMPVLFEFEQQFQEQFNTSFQGYVDLVSEVGYKFDQILMEINYLITAK